MLGNKICLSNVSYGLSDHMIDFFVVKVFMALLETKKKFLKLPKCPRVRNDVAKNSGGVTKKPMIVLK